jgi:hypothetical protein
MNNLAKVSETLVIGEIPADHTKALVRLQDPDLRVPIVPETLLTVCSLPSWLRLVACRPRIEDWFYVRYVLMKSQTGQELEAIDFGKESVVLEALPPGLAAQVCHVPLYSEPLPKQLIWPDWQMPPRKGWLLPRLSH